MLRNILWWLRDGADEDVPEVGGCRKEIVIDSVCEGLVMIYLTGDTNGPLDFDRIRPENLIRHGVFWRE